MSKGKADYGDTCTGRLLQELDRDLQENGSESILARYFLRSFREKATRHSTDELIERRGYQYRILGHLRKYEEGTESTVIFLQALIDLLCSNHKFVSVVERKGADTDTRISKDDISPRRQIYELFRGCGLTDKKGITEDLDSISSVLHREDVGSVLKENGYLGDPQKDAQMLGDLSEGILSVIAYYSAWELLRNYQKKKEGTTASSEKQGSQTVKKKKASSTKEEKDNTILQIIDFYYENHGFLFSQEGGSTTESVTKAMRFLREHWEQLPASAMIPVTINAGTGCGIYILGKDNIDPEDVRPDTRPQIAVLLPELPNGGVRGKYELTTASLPAAYDRDIFTDRTDKIIHTERIESDYEYAIEDTLSAIVDYNCSSGLTEKSKKSAIPDEYRRYFFTQAEEEQDKQVAKEKDNISIQKVQASLKN